MYKYMLVWLLLLITSCGTRPALEDCERGVEDIDLVVERGAKFYPEPKPLFDRPFDRP